MPRYRSDLMRELAARGFIFQATDAEGLDRLAAERSLPCYIGFDCTAPSLHVGSLVQIMMLRRAQQCGHKPIVLMGGGTTRIGDPSGKDETRRLLTDAEIEQNKTSIFNTFKQFLEFGDKPSDAIMVDNAEWLDELRTIPFLREIGRHFTVNRMLSFESVKMRLEREQPLTFLEFNYMILQAYDFLELARRYDCRLQMGGSDQWGNIVCGIELGRRVDGRELFGLTTPLLTTASGRKMGKTAEGAVWLNEEGLRAYDYYQFWRNTADADVGRFLRLFTDLPLEEIARLEQLAGREINDVKKILAFETTRLARGREAAVAAQATAEATFEQKDAAGGLYTVTLDPEAARTGVGILSLFVSAGLAKSNKEARRLIAQGGARMNDTSISDDGLVITPDDLSGGPIKLSAGKKRHALVALAGSRERQGGD